MDWDSVARLGFGSMPHGPQDREVDVLFDEGSWVGWALPDEAHAGGWVGPYDLRRPGFVAADALRFELQSMELVSAEAQREPGRLLQRLDYGVISVEMSLYFGGATQAIARFEIINNDTHGQTVAAQWSGRVFEGTTVTGEGAAVRFSGPGRRTAVTLHFPAGRAVVADDQHYRVVLPPLDLFAGEHRTLYVQLTSEGEDPDEAARDSSANRARWAQRLRGVWEASSTPMGAEDRRLAARAVETLVANWRRPSGKVTHEGLFPAWAYDGFHGFWAWDSWKHAVAVARFDPRLAKEQIRVMLNAQNDAGMVPDVIYPGDEQDNWRDTKPPLAAWAVEEVFAVDGDLAFVEEVLPRVLKYHAWWFAQRDHDGNALCEYGSTDGTVIAAAWESGMDNAVRFDGAKMLKNSDDAWSMDRHSVDLNAYLVAEKRILARLLAAAGRAEEAEVYRRSATTMAAAVRQMFWDDARGWFRDRRLDGEFAPGWGPEGWIPLWAGIATPQQAARVRDAMIDPAKFGTHMPLGTLAADDPQFDPTRGYWRGPVWLDQAYFGLAGLRRYGFSADANELSARLLDHGQGLRQGGPIRENYHPQTGAGQNARHFSWSAASILMMLWELPAPQ